MSAPERPVPIRAADSAARKITYLERLPVQQYAKQKTARSTSTIPTAAAAGDSGLTEMALYAGRETRSLESVGYVDGITSAGYVWNHADRLAANVNGNWYYLNSKGAMQTGWLLKEGKYYFLNTDGTMAYGWVNSQGSWYYSRNQTETC